MTVAIVILSLGFGIYGRNSRSSGSDGLKTLQTECGSCCNSRYIFDEGSFTRIEVTYQVRITIEAHCLTDAFPSQTFVSNSRDTPLNPGNVCRHYPPTGEEAAGV